MIKLFVSVDLHSESDEPKSHTFCFNYGSMSLENFTRAARDYMYNKSHARYVELNVEGKPVYGDEIAKAFALQNDTTWSIFFHKFKEPFFENTHLPIEKVG